MSSKKKALKVIKPVQKPVQKKAVEKKAESKMDMCEGYLTDHPGLKRKDAIKVFQEKYGLTPAGSSTYWAIIKKRLNYK